MRFWRDTPKKRNVHKPKKRVVPTYRGMGLSLVPPGFVTGIKTREQEEHIIDAILGRPPRKSDIG